MSLDYMDPGLAATNGFEGALQQQANVRRQALMDQIAVQEANRKARHDSEEHELAVQALEEKRQEMKFKVEDRERNSTLKIVENMQPGDVPEAVTQANAKKYGIPLRMTPPQVPQEAVTGPGPDAPAALQSNEDAAVAVPVAATSAPEAAAPPDAAMAPPSGSVRLAPPPPAGISTGYGTGTYAGSPKYLAEERDRQRILDYAATLPDGPEKQSLVHNAMTGKNAPAGEFKKPSAPGAGDREHPVIYVDPRTHTMQMNDPDQNGKLVTITAPPEGSTPHFVMQPPPPNGDAMDFKQGAARDREYDKTLSRLEKAATPINSTLNSLSKLGIAINDMSPGADQLIAPLVIQAFVSGEGSGFRMTKAEIDNLRGGRSAWQDLEARLNRWSLDPSQALSITDDQRIQLRQLAKKAKQYADRQKKILDDSRDEMDSATTSGEVQKVYTKFQKNFHPTEETETANTPKKKLTDYLKAAGIE